MSAIDTALDEYQRFTKLTAQYPEALAVPYLALGLGDEAGELLEKINLVVTPEGLGRGMVWSQRHVLPEGGDVCWYLAQLLLQREIPLSGVYAMAVAEPARFEASLLAAGIEVSMAASAIQGRVKKELRDGINATVPIVAASARILRGLEAIARWHRVSLIEVVNANREKLGERLVRGTIKGEGDTR